MGSIARFQTETIEEGTGKSLMQGIMEGRYVIKKNPWLSGKLKEAAEKVGVNVKTKEYVARTPPWSRGWYYLKALRPRQKVVIAMLTKVSSENADKPIAERIKAIREFFATNKSLIEKAPPMRAPRTSGQGALILREVKEEYGVEL